MLGDILLFSLVFIVAIVVGLLSQVDKLLEGCWHKWTNYDEPMLMNGSYIQRRQCTKCNALEIRVTGQHLEKKDG